MLWRVTHGSLTAGFLAAIAAIWTAAITGRKGRWLSAAIAAVACEGVVVALNHGWVGYAYTYCCRDCSVLMRSAVSWRAGRGVRTSAQALAERSRIVLAAAEGLKNTEIADRLGVRRQSVTKWRNRFAEHRLDGLVDEPRPGRPGR